MEHINYREEYRKLFAAYKANTGELTSSSKQMINSLLELFPYCQPLHVISASALKSDASALEDRLTRISIISPRRESLYQLIHRPEKITVRGTIISPEPETETEKSLVEPPETNNVSVLDTLELTPETEDDPIDFQELKTDSAEVKKTAVTLEDSLSLEDLSAPHYFEVDKSVQHIEGLHEEVLEQAEISQSPDETSNKSTPISSVAKREAHKISRYNDETLPFTFLWWLNKTRKEHADTYQPYVSFKLDTSRAIRRSTADNLNQQIMENIFHLQVPLEDEDTSASANTVEFKLKRKDEELIDKFIKQDPQIRPMQPDQISTENKARKSSEDHNDLVSETLARIYIEQMLFDKAIDTYKKLSLKFPEKKAYFADQISDLQKKIN